MFPKLRIAILLFCSVLQIRGYTDISLFYQDVDIHPHSCSFELETPANLNCACVNGLWFLFESCGEIKAISGRRNHCTKLNGSPVSKAVQMIKNPEDLSLVRSDGTVLPLTAENVKETYIDNEVLLLTGSEWTLIDSSGLRICLSALEANSYCFFSNSERSNWRLHGMEMGCDDYDYFVDPTKCIRIGKETTNICEEIHRISKRDAGEEGGAPAPPAADGGAPAPAGGDSGNASAIFQEMMPEDEDYEAATANNTSNATDSPVSIEKGIIDYMDSNLDNYLGLETISMGALTGRSSGLWRGRKNKKKLMQEKGRTLAEDEENEIDAMANLLNVTYPNPVYEFLDLAKRITQKTCPHTYVKPEFLNLATLTFIRMQQAEFKFPENTFRPSGFRRVLNALRACEAGAVKFNFTDNDCDGKLDGRYEYFDEKLELSLSSDYVNLEKDPIVETVWKIFFNAHSYCFPYFNKTLDHHRFTTWMIPLFQHEMNDLWNKGETSNKSLSGLFGDQIVVQGNLGYCAVSSRLVSKYPWDLPRPTRVSTNGTDTPAAAGAGGTGGAGDPSGPPPPPPAGDDGAATGGKDRKKREVDILELDYSFPATEENCLDASRPMLCPTHIKSFAMN